MWVRRNLKSVFLDPSEYFLNLGNTEENQLKKIVTDMKYSEVVNLQFTKKIVVDVQEAFTILDRNRKSEGTIRPRDVKLTLRSLGIEPTSKKVKKLMNKVVAKRAAKKYPSDELSREEFEKLMYHVVQDIDSEEQIMQSFKMFDVNGTGFVTIEDLRRIAHQLEIDLSEEEMKEMIDIADKDKDGKVTMEEFKDSARKIF